MCDSFIARKVQPSDRPSTFVELCVKYLSVFGTVLFRRESKSNKTCIVSQEQQTLQGDSNLGPAAVVVSRLTIDTAGATGIHLYVKKCSLGLYELHFQNCRDAWPVAFGYDMSRHKYSLPP